MYFCNIYEIECKILRTIENLKNSISGEFFGEIGVYFKNLIMVFCCTLFHEIFLREIGP